MISPSQRNYFIKLLISIGLLTWFLSRINAADIFKYLLSLPLMFFMLGLLLSFIGLGVNSLKWHFLLRQHHWLVLLRLNLIGQYYSIILPGQVAGEAVKVFRLGKHQEDWEQVTASVLIDRLTGIIGLIILGILGLLGSKASLPQLVWIWILSGLLLGGILVLYLVRFNWAKNLLDGLLDKTQNWPEKISNPIGRFRIFLKHWQEYMNRPYLLFICIIFGTIYQLLGVIIVFLLARGLAVNISFSDWCWISFLVSLAIFLPISIGGIGVREGSLVGLLGWFGVPGEKALALSFATFALLLIIAAWGLVLELKKA